MSLPPLCEPNGYAALLIGAVLSVMAAQNSASSEPKTNYFTAEVSQVELKIGLPQSAVAKEQMQIEATVINHTTQPIRIGVYGSFPDSVLKISSRDGKACEMTTRGQNMFGEPIAPRWSYGFQAIQPGESKTWTTKLDRYFVLKPDRYTLGLKLSRVEGMRSTPAIEGASFSIQAE